MPWKSSLRRPLLGECKEAKEMKCIPKDKYKNSLAFWKRIIGRRLSFYDVAYGNYENCLLINVWRIDETIVFVYWGNEGYKMENVVPDICQLKVLPDNEESIIWRLENGL